MSNSLKEACSQLGYVNEGKLASYQVHNPTVAENIDNRIAMHEAEIVRLRNVKAKLESGDIASIPIQDLRSAMSY